MLAEVPIAQLDMLSRIALVLAVLSMLLLGGAVLFQLVYLWIGTDRKDHPDV